MIDGEVLQVHSFWDPSGRIMITDAIIRVTDSVLGNAGSAVVVRTFGGMTNGAATLTSGLNRIRERGYRQKHPEKPQITIRNQQVTGSSRSSAPI